MMIDIDGLRKFLISSEGADPPVFAGRKEELNLLMNVPGEASAASTSGGTSF